MASIQLRTAIPGPRSQELMRRRNDAVPRGVYPSTPLFAARAEGALVEDVDGNTFIDLAGGIGCVNVGHRAEPVMAAIQAQTEKYLHTCFSVSPYEGYVRVAERLNQMTPGKFPKKTLLVNTGAEAVENAVKIARAYTGRPGVICFDHGFHGRTILTLAMTSKVVPYKKDMGPLAPDVFRAPAPYPYRDIDTEQAIAGLELIFKQDVAPARVACMVLEPVQGEGGFIAMPVEFIGALKAICEQHGIVYVDDEVQAGAGRTGTLWAIEH